jgi:1-acyl-sn-glycerol-3-phosphate acyltransferase
MTEAADLPMNRMERIALAIGELANEHEPTKWIQNRFLRGVTYPWVRFILGNRMLIEGIDEVVALRPEAGVMVVSNHRTFFDQFATMLAFYNSRVPWLRELLFPVRSNFFYERPVGVLLNVAISGTTMYPPIYRQADRRKLNDDALDKMAAYLQRPGALLGMHPEGTRGKTDDPYKLLPAQPGVGKVALMARPMVIPLFLQGLSNDFVFNLRANFTSRARRDGAVVGVFGPPVDYDDLLAEKPRPTLYKKAADRFMAAIKALGERERALRAEIAAGRIADDDPRWLTKRPNGVRLYAFEPKL